MPIYSNSRLSTFEKCPLQYRFRYIDRIPRDTQGIEAFLGNRVHEVLEHLHRGLGDGTVPALEDLLALYRGNWDGRISDRVMIVKTDYDAGHYRRIGERCITNYYRGRQPFDQDVTLALEERFLIALDGGDRYRVQGYIDRLARRGPGVYVIHDYKTSSRLPSDADLRRDRQLTFYQMGVADRFQDAREIELVWHYLAFGETLVSRRTAPEIEEHRRRTISLIDEIEAAREYPAKESALCRWCDYRDICPLQEEQVRREARGESPAPRPAVPRRAEDATARAGGNASGPGPAAPSGPMVQMDLFS